MLCPVNTNENASVWARRRKSRLQQLRETHEPLWQCYFFTLMERTLAEQNLRRLYNRNDEKQSFSRRPDYIKMGDSLRIRGVEMC